MKKKSKKFEVFPKLGHFYVKKKKGNIYINKNAIIFQRNSFEKKPSKPDQN
jgi:hypothetical protein